jgi:hypothetical protein
LSDYIFDGEVHYDADKNIGYMAIDHNHEAMKKAKNIGEMQHYILDKMRKWLKENGRKLDTHSFVYSPIWLEDGHSQERYYFLQFTLELMMVESEHTQRS